MNAAEAYESITRGGTTDFARVVAAFEGAGAWCLIGDLAVNTYVEPVYSLDAAFVLVGSRPGFAFEEFEHFLNAQGAGSELRIQFTTDARYQAFPERAVDVVVLGVPVSVACLADTTQRKLWAYGDPRRRLSKRKKDELDLIRLAEAWPELRAMYPAELLEEIDRG